MSYEQFPWNPARGHKIENWLKGISLDGKKASTWYKTSLRRTQGNGTDAAVLIRAVIYGTW